MLIAQLSDVHVRPRGALYKDVADSNRMLGEAIAHLHRLDRQPDLLLVTGDIVDEGRPEEYETALAVLGTLRLPWIVMPGNHDDRDNFRAAFAAHDYHRAMARRWAGTIVLTCPSTATEIALQLDPAARPRSFMGPPACLLHLWDPQHGLVSHTSYIGEYPGPYPFF